MQFSEPFVFFADLAWLLNSVTESMGPSVPGLLGKKKDPEHNPTNICIFRICAIGRKSFRLPKYLECLLLSVFPQDCKSRGRGDGVCRLKCVKLISK